MTIGYDDRAMTVNLGLSAVHRERDGSVRLEAFDLADERPVRVDFAPGAKVPPLGDVDVVAVTGRFARPNAADPAAEFAMLASEVRPGLNLVSHPQVRRGDEREALDPFAGDAGASIRVTARDLARAHLAHAKGREVKSVPSELALKVADSHVTRDADGRDLVVFSGARVGDGAPVRVEFPGAHARDERLIDDLARAGGDVLQLSGFWRRRPEQAAQAAGWVGDAVLSKASGVFAPTSVNGVRVDRISGLEEDAGRMRDAAHKIKALEPATVLSRYADALVVQSFATQPKLSVVDSGDGRGPAVGLSSVGVPNWGFVSGGSALKMLADFAEKGGATEVTVTFDLERARKIERQREFQAERQAQAVRQAGGVGR